jgi:hypothetical protein
MDQQKLRQLEDAFRRIADLGANLEKLSEETFPGLREAREAAARCGYQGRRHGWYPARPHRRPRR